MKAITLPLATDEVLLEVAHTGIRASCVAHKAHSPEGVMPEPSRQFYRLIVLTVKDRDLLGSFVGEEGVALDGGGDEIDVGETSPLTHGLDNHLTAKGMGNNMITVLASVEQLPPKPHTVPFKASCEDVVLRVVEVPREEATITKPCRDKVRGLLAIGQDAVDAMDDGSHDLTRQRGPRSPRAEPHSPR